ncbi:MAG: ECF transporter S component [Defluviitaleaceae bacterium]|nr:ECF transporter S component [Defluviitaleaceae bacterium]
MSQSSTGNLIMSAMFLAIGIVLPFLTGQIPQIGMMLLPMHIPVLLCGLICGWKYGAVVGFSLPLLRSMMFGMPMLFPMAIAMAFELAVYGLVIGLLYARSRWQCVVALYRALICAMVAGRIVWGAAMVVMLGIQGGTFTFQAFVTASVVSAAPGIVLQLVLIPSVMLALNRVGLIHFNREKRDEVPVGYNS